MSKYDLIVKMKMNIFDIMQDENNNCSLLFLVRNISIQYICGIYDCSIIQAYF